MRAWGTAALAFFLVGAACPAEAAPAAPAPVNVIATLPLRDGLHLGVNHAHIHQRGHGYGSDTSAREMDVLRKVGINAVALTPFAYQDGATATQLAGYPPHGPPNDTLDASLRGADLTAEIQQARARGLIVMVKPHLWSRDFWNGGEWQGTIRQETAEGHARWWKSFRAFILHYAALSQAAGAQWYCIGTELRVMTTRHPEEWRVLVADVRKVFQGKVTYAAHWDGEFETITFWDVLDAAGVNAYFPLAAADDASPAALQAAWEPHVRRLNDWQARIQRPVIFTEVGYRTAKGTWRKPWEDKGGAFDEAAQAHAYEAMFTVFAPRTWWGGFYLWKTFTDPARTSRWGDGDGFSFRNRAAERLLQRWLIPTR
jgi:hypothetical protein